MKNVVTLTMVFTLGLFQIGSSEATMRLQRKQQQRQQVVDGDTTSTLQCYVCENCPDNIDELGEMVLCGAISSSVISSGNVAAPVPITTTIKPLISVPAAGLSEEYSDSDLDEEDGDYNESDERKAIRTLTLTTVKSTTSTETPITTTISKAMPAIVENLLINKIPDENFNSYEYESEESEETTRTTTTASTATTTTTSSTVTTSKAMPAIVENASVNKIPEEDFNSYEYESEESKESIETTKGTTTTTTTTTMPPIVIENNASDKDFDNYEYEDELEDLEDYDRHRSGGAARQSNLNPNVCYSIKLSNSKTVVTNRGCATLIRGNKALTCQSLANGLQILDCLVCDTNGCNSHSNQFVPSTAKPSSSQGLKVSNFWTRLLPVAVIIVAIFIRPYM